MTIVRGQQVMEFPTRFMLVAASNPCPCGLGDRDAATPAVLARHRRRLSGPLLDRVDILMRVERPPSEALRKQAAPASGAIRERVIAARERQEHRLAGQPETCNAQLTSRQIREVAASRPAPSGCSASSTTATPSRPAATPGSSASPARSPTSTAPTSSAPSTSTSPPSLRLDDAHPLAEAA